MMTNNMWDEDRIEKLLGETPDIKDTRSKEDLLKRLHQDERLQNPMNEKRNRKKAIRWIPVIASVVALFMLSFLLPSMLNGGNSKLDEAADTMSISTDKNMENSESSSKAAQNEDQAGEELEVKSTLADVEGGDAHFAVYPDDIGNNIIFRLGLVGDAAASVPVTFIIPRSQIEEDFGKVQPTSFDLYEEYASKIDEEILGFYDYHPYKGELAIEGENVIQTLPKGHGYDSASASMEVHKGTLQDTFYGFSAIQFENQDGTPIEFDQVGKPSKPLRLSSGTNYYNYYIFKQANGQEYLLSNFSKTYDNLEMALHEMKNKPNDIFSPAIPMAISFEVIEEKKLTKVKFKEPLDLQSMNPKEAKQMIDAILLTGASFEVQLQFENVLQDEWNGFNFKEPLPIPVGSNLLPFLLK